MNTPIFIAALHASHPVQGGTDAGLEIIPLVKSLYICGTSLLDNTSILAVQVDGAQEFTQKHY